MKNKNWAGYAAASGLLATISVICPSTASADATGWSMPDVTKTNLAAAVSTISGSLGTGAQLVLLQPGTEAPANAPANTLYLYPMFAKGDLQPVYDLPDWIVCQQTPAAGDIITLEPKTKIEVKIARPKDGCPK